MSQKMMVRIYADRNDVFTQEAVDSLSVDTLFMGRPARILERYFDPDQPIFIRLMIEVEEEE